MNRTTNKHLENLVDLINSTTSSPENPWKRDSADKLQGQVGNFHLSRAYGGFSLHRMVNESGGIRDVFSCGHVTKRELYQRMDALLRGLEFNA